MIQSTQNPQVVKAYRMVLRYLRRHKLKAGDLLPVQLELRQELGFGNDTLVKAMKLLVEDGVLERRQRVGTVVQDISKASLADHTVVLAMVTHTMQANEPFYGSLMRSLDGYVRQILGAQMRIMTQVDSDVRLSKWPLDSFAGVREMAINGEIDAVICPIAVISEQINELVELGVPWLHVSSHEDAPCGVIVDQKPMLKQACEMLFDRGCRRISVVALEKGCYLQLRFWRGYMQAVELLGLEPQSLLESGAISIEAGRNLGRRLLAMPASDRPDGLVMIHDSVASGLTDVLRDQVEYRPEIAVQSSVPGSLIFGLPVIRFDVDVYGLARQTVEQLNQVWSQPHASADRQWFIPEMAHERALDVQMSSVGQSC